MACRTGLIGLSREDEHTVEMRPPLVFLVTMFEALGMAKPNYVCTPLLSCSLDLVGPIPRLPFHVLRIVSQLPLSSDQSS